MVSLKLRVVLSQHLIPKRASRELEGVKIAASFVCKGELLELALTGQVPTCLVRNIRLPTLIV